MKKLGFIISILLFALALTSKPAGAEYLSEYDQYVEISSKQATDIAKLLGIPKSELGEETAQQSFELQEMLIAQIEKITGTEFDHYYIWLTIDGVPVLAIDPPTPLY